jgi:hypothetical protein
MGPSGDWGEMMRSLVVVLLVALAIVLGAEVVYLMMQSPAVSVSFRDDGKVEPPPVVQVAKKLPEPARPVIRKAEDDGNISVHVDAIPLPPLMWPSTPEEIKVGMKKDQLRTVLGQPCAQTVTLDHGQLLEVYVFPGKDGNKVTVAQLRDGVVVSAYARTH